MSFNPFASGGIDPDAFPYYTLVKSDSTTAEGENSYTWTLVKTEPLEEYRTTEMGSIDIKDMFVESGEVATGSELGDSSLDPDTLYLHLVLANAEHTVVNIDVTDLVDKPDANKIPIDNDNITAYDDTLTVLKNNFGSDITVNTTVEDILYRIAKIVGEFEDTLEDHESRITTNEEDIDKIENQITDIYSKIDTIETEIDTLEQTVNDNYTDLSNKITSINNQITTINNQIEAIEGDISTIKTTLTDYGTRITTLESKVTTIEGNITTIKNSITSIENRLSTAETNITDIQTDIDEIWTAINNLKDIYVSAASYSDGTLTLTRANSTPLTVDLSELINNDLVGSQTDYGTISVSDSTISLDDAVGKFTNSDRTSEIFNDYTNNIASGNNSHAEGCMTTASSSCAHAEGYKTSVTSTYAHAEGQNSAASGIASHAEGYITTSSGSYSHAEGKNVTASGDYSHAEGESTTASGHGSHAEGSNTQATILDAHAEGNNTRAIENYSHAEGFYTLASGVAAHAEGGGRYIELGEAYDRLTASGDYSHAEGYNSKARGNYSHAENSGVTTVDGISSHAEGSGETSASYAHAEGEATKATGTSSHAEGFSSTAAGSFSHAEGQSTAAEGSTSHAEGMASKTSGDYSHAEGNSTEALGSSSHAEGESTIASGDSSHSEGDSSVASGIGSHAEGKSTTASGNYSHSEGKDTQALSTSDHAEGVGTTASGGSCHAEGNNAKATGNNSHAEGSGTTASGNNSHAEGGSTTASGSHSHAEGENTSATEKYTHSGGYGSIAGAEGSFSYGKYAQTSNEYEAAFGQYNKSISDNSGYNTTFTVGGGTASTRQNLFYINENGSIWAKENYLPTLISENSDLDSTDFICINKDYYANYTQAQTISNLPDSSLLDQTNNPADPSKGFYLKCRYYGGHDELMDNYTTTDTSNSCATQTLFAGKGIWQRNYIASAWTDWDLIIYNAEYDLDLSEEVDHDGNILFDVTETSGFDSYPFSFIHFQRQGKNINVIGRYAVKTGATLGYADDIQDYNFHIVSKKIPVGFRPPMNIFKHFDYSKGVTAADAFFGVNIDKSGQITLGGKNSYTINNVDTTKYPTGIRVDYSDFTEGTFNGSSTSGLLGDNAFWFSASYLAQ